MEAEQGAATTNSPVVTATTVTTTATATATTNNNNNTTTTNSNSSSGSSNSSTVAPNSSSASTSTTTSTAAANSSANSNANANGGANTSSSSSVAGRQTLPQISVYSGIPDRQTVQVIQQALHRQPSTAAQYLQQMYAAQQQHLMLQTAALQQQHLSTAQLQSLAAVQQASIAAGRQTASSTQTGSSSATINLTTSPAAAQLISRAQSVSSAPAGISQQAVLLGNPTSPTLTASQAQMYLRAQMAQQSNLVQVARSLGRAVPLSPQLIFTPTATVTALQTDAVNANTQTASAQVQNLAIRSQQGAVSSSSPTTSTSSTSTSSTSSSTTTTTSSSSSSSSSSALTQTQALQALSLKQTPVSIQPTPLIKTPLVGIKPAPTTTTTETNHQAVSQAGTGKKNDVAMAAEPRAVNMSRNVCNSGGHPLIAPAYAHIQPHSLVKQQQQPAPQQFVIQQQLVNSTPQRGGSVPATSTLSGPTQLLQADPIATGTTLPQLHAQALTVHPVPVGLTTTSRPVATSGPTGPVPVLPKPAMVHHQNHQNQGLPHQLHQPHTPATTSQQATIFHSTISPHGLGQHPQAHQHPAHAHGPPHSHTALSQAKAQPVQLTAINLQIHPTPNQASRLAPECKDKPTALVVRESCPPHSSQLPTSSSPQGAKPAEQPKTDTLSSTASTTATATVTATVTATIHQTQAETTERVSVSPAALPSAMTSGNDSEAPAVVGSTAQNGENKPPQAIVKPHVLTHVIEGFVIQEGAEPFPMDRPPIQNDSPKKPERQLPSDPETSPIQHLDNNTDSEPEDPNQHGMIEQEEEPKLTCEFCGHVDFAYKFKGTKRFCSMVCAKRYNVGCTKRIGLFHPDRTKTTSRWRRRAQRGRPTSEAKRQKLTVHQQTPSGSVSSPMPSQPSQGESSPCSDMSSFEEPPSPLSVASSGPPLPMARSLAQYEQSPRPDGMVAESRDHPLLPQHFLPCDPTKWNVEEVYEFIRSLPGCQEIADEFRSQEIDGQAMLLLKEDHLMSTMNIKLGPALKLYARISMLKDS